MLVNVLEGLHDAEDLLDVAADGGVVEGGVAEDSLAVDDEEGAAGVARVAEEGVVLDAEVLGEIGEEGEVQGASETTGLAGDLGPGEVGVEGVDGGAEDDGVDGVELGEVILEGEDLAGADEGEVEGVEEEDDVLAGVVGERDLLEFSADEGIDGEFRGSATNAKRSESRSRTSSHFRKRCSICVS